MVYKTTYENKLNYKNDVNINNNNTFLQESVSIISSILVGMIFIVFLCSSNSVENNVTNDDNNTSQYNISLENTYNTNTNNTKEEDNAENNDNLELSSSDSINFSDPIPAWSQNISSHFGDREDPINGGEEYHQGLDIAMPQGTPISAVLDGIVTISEENSSSYGKYIEITHNDNLKTRYAHCSQLNVKVGDSVKSGDIIALVGSTGNSTGPHLHLEVIENGQKVNPENYLK